jgi:hypothetical protein
MAKSSISTVLKNKNEIKSAQAAKGISRLCSSPGTDGNSY